MDASQARLAVLQAEGRRIVIRCVFGLSASWLFTAFSFHVTRKTGIDWFTRSGSVMALMGAATTFLLTGNLQRLLVIALREGHTSVQQGIELSFDPSKRYNMASYFSYLTGIVGTAIWGYGDLLSQWVSTFLTG